MRCSRRSSKSPRLTMKSARSSRSLPASATTRSSSAPSSMRGSTASGAGSSMSIMNLSTPGFRPPRERHQSHARAAFADGGATPPGARLTTPLPSSHRCPRPSVGPRRRWRAIYAEWRQAQSARNESQRRWSLTTRRHACPTSVPRVELTCRSTARARFRSSLLPAQRSGGRRRKGAFRRGQSGGGEAPRP